MFRITLFMIACILHSTIALGATWHVDDSQTTITPPPDGTSWNTAFKFLQDALTASSPDDVIIVAGGTYFPDDDDDLPSSTHTQGDRNASFVMKDRVLILGGFKGIPGLVDGTQDDRDTQAFETILSGDLDENDLPDFNDPSRGENSFSVVNGGVATTDLSELNGLTIRNGHGGTFSPGTTVTAGAGVFVPAGSSPRFRNCLITRNWVSSIDIGSIREGGGLFLDGASDSLIEDCRFIDNEANKGGGFACHFNSNPVIDRCIFADNTASNVGGAAVFIKINCDAQFRDCLFTDNQLPQAPQSGAAVTGGGAALICTESQALFRRCVFQRNLVFGAQGGAVTTDDSSPITVVDCSFT